MKFLIVIAGCRDFDHLRLKNLKVVKDAVSPTLSSKIRDGHKVVIVSGCARGADKLGELFAKSEGHEVLRFPANWNLHGDSAGIIRNEQMAKVANAVVVFWDGVSTGTENMIKNANKHKLPVRAFDFLGKRRKEWETLTF